MKPGVAQAALEAGASVVNDVAANREEEAMWRLVAETGAGYVCLHMQGTPQTMQVQPVYRDVVAEVAAFFRERLERLAHCGVRPEQVILDPGIGFGKTFEHNLELLAALPTLAGLGRPLLVGVSRKSFMARSGGPARPRRCCPAGWPAPCWRFGTGRKSCGFTTWPQQFRLSAWRRPSRESEETHKHRLSCTTFGMNLLTSARR